jgi:hypothetical protein
MSFVGVGYCIQNSTDVLPFDIEVIVVDIFKYYYIYTVRFSSLKDFCYTEVVEYKKNVVCEMYIIILYYYFQFIYKY